MSYDRTPLRRALSRELSSTNKALQAQMQGMLVAEQELTSHLKVTHLDIEQQLAMLKEQLKVRG